MTCELLPVSGSQRTFNGRCCVSLRLQGASNSEEKIPHLDAQTFGDTLEHSRRRILLSAFDLCKVRDGDVRAFGNLPQGEPTLGAGCSQRLTDGRKQIHLPLRGVDLQRLHDVDSIPLKAKEANRPPTPRQYAPTRRPPPALRMASPSAPERPPALQGAPPTLLSRCATFPNLLVPLPPTTEPVPGVVEVQQEARLALFYRWAQLGRAP